MEKLYDESTSDDECTTEKGSFFSWGDANGQVEIEKCLVDSSTGGTMEHDFFSVNFCKYSLLKERNGA